MKSLKAIFLLTCGLILLAASELTAQQEKETCLNEQQTYYSAVEINDVLCGYSIDRECMIDDNGKNVLYQTANITVKLTVLGSGVDINMNFEFKVEPETMSWYESRVEINQGGAIITNHTRVIGDTAYFYEMSQAHPKKIPLGPDIKFESNLSYPHIYADFILGGSEEKTYQVFDIFTGEVIEKKYVKKVFEDQVFNDSVYQTLLLEETDMSRGLSARVWFDAGNGLPLKTIVAGRHIYLSDKSVVGRITKVDFDNVIFARVDKIIPDFQNLSFMKVAARIQSAGEPITVESLNQPGQKFTGTVENNFIDGIFELEPVRYDGKNAPPFPPDFSADESLAVYLEPAMLIESDNPLIAEEARKITESSADSWEAAVRLSQWVAENIMGAVPGGTSAINTYTTRQGECGSHSRLMAAFCRAVGIPARLAVGCMYSTSYQGSFGQHAWNEVYMGDAGWIPVDATIFEYDYIDAGHIRLGEQTSFQPEKMEILDYKVGSGETTEINDIVPDVYSLFPGKYTNLVNNTVYTVIYKDNALAVDIPGQMVLALNDADEQGKFYPKLTRQICFSFHQDTEGHVDLMTLTQTVNIPRKEDADTNYTGVPETYAPYTGSYALAPAKIDFDLTYEDGMLSMPDLLNRTTQAVLLSAVNDAWTDSNGIYEISFLTDANGKVTHMLASINFRCPKGEPAALVIEPIIYESGIEVALEKYAAMKDAAQGQYLFTERLMNTLGYKLLSQDKLTEAIEVFKINAQEHPDSFNVYDSLGEAYMKNGDKDMAVINYEKSIQLNPNNENGKSMLEKLNKMK